MSMISAQIDELRRMADGQATYRDARAVMLKAADTITELRGALSVASVDYRHLSEENDKLRELAVGMYGMLEMFDTLLGNHDACETPRPLVFGEDKSFKDTMRELGLVDE